MAIRPGAQVGPFLRVVSALLVVFVARVFYLLSIDSSVQMWQLILIGIFLAAWCGLFGFASVAGRAPSWFTSATTDKRRR